jgi:NAD dependent epimerase/dehydratase family enzyme
MCCVVITGSSGLIGRTLAHVLAHITDMRSLL